MSPKRGTISVSAACFARVRAYTEANNCSMSWLVEQLLEPILPSELPDAPPRRPASRPALDRETIDRIAADRQAAGLVASALPRAPRAGTRLVALDVSPHVVARLCEERARIRATDGQGRVRLSPILDAAINRMLDELAVRPWCRRCLLVVEDCRCSPQQVQADILARYKEIR